ncbi:MAG: undecaprenyl-diphosphate phosphatase [bacterium]|nr:undecaprenyl-diphosphate phosphatase [bacterium]
MSIFQAIVLGIVQGVTEFLPISSSGHLVMFPEIFGWPLQDVAFDAVIHLATLLVIIFYFRKDLLTVFKSKRLTVMLLVAAVPIGLVGGLWGDLIGERFRDPKTVLLLLAIWGAVLIRADIFSSKQKNTEDDLKNLKWWQVITIGLAQVLALAAGTSRSGITITAGLYSGLSRKLAARFAFLVGVIPIAAAGFMKSLDVASGEVAVGFLPLAVGFTAALVSGYLAVHWLMKLLEKVTYKGFGWYRITVAVLLLFLVF